MTRHSCSKRCPSRLALEPLLHPNPGRSFARTVDLAPFERLAETGSALRPPAPPLRLAFNALGSRKLLSKEGFGDEVCTPTMACSRTSGTPVNPDSYVPAVSLETVALEASKAKHTTSSRKMQGGSYFPEDKIKLGAYS